MHHPAPTLVTVTFAGAGGKTQAIVCTPEHPFFVDGKGWVEAGSLGIGTSIVTRAGPTLAVKSLDWKRSGQQAGATTPAFTVYNFTVDASHTFFVGSVNGGAWTHNNNCPIKPGWVKDGGSFINWVRNAIDRTKYPLDKEGADQLVNEAREHGLEVGADAKDLAGHPNTNWPIPHIHIEPNKVRLHVAVPPGYEIP